MNQAGITARPVSHSVLASTLASPRVSWVDTAKGFGIILVVFGHVLGGVVTSGLMTWTTATRFVDAWIYTFHMPLFFFLSGLFIPHSASNRWGSFALNKLCTIAYPYFVWSLITVLVKSSLGGITNHSYNISDLWLIFYKPVDQFWFLYVLFVLSISVSALLKFGFWPWLVFVIAIMVYLEILPIPLQWGVLYETRSYAIYFALGVAIAANRDLQLISRIQVEWLTVAFVMGLATSSLGGLSDLPNWLAIKPFLAVAGTVSIVALSVLADRMKLSDPIKFLGRYSLEIYAAHIMASAFVRIVFEKVAYISAPSAHLLIGTLAGLYGPIMLVIIFRWVGFRYGFKLPQPLLLKYRVHSIRREYSESEEAS
jgi:fucose 4-O-acetylase-like acetyltransferase